MKKRESTILVLYVVIFVIIAFILSNFMFLEKEEVTITTHGVEICNKNYDCGEEDRVCPEDYGARCVLEDPDCK